MTILLIVFLVITGLATATSDKATTASTQKAVADTAAVAEKPVAVADTTRQTQQEPKPMPKKSKWPQYAKYSAIGV